MGLEKIVINKLAEVNPELARNAYFYNGTLFIRNAKDFTAIDLYRMGEAIKSVVTCSLDLSYSGNEFAIDFM